MNEKVAIVLMYYGFPNEISEMRDYLMDIIGGKQPPQWLIDENLNKLKSIGGRTPSIGIVQSIRDKLGQLFDLPVYLLTKHYKPNLRDAAKIIREKKIIEIPLFPFFSRQIFDSYYLPLENSMGNRDFFRIENIGLHPNVILYYRDKFDYDSRYPIFSAHSQLIKGYDPYPINFLKAMKEIADNREFLWFYHSQGPFGGRWLGPGMDYVIEQLKKKNIDKVIDIPIGFLYEHIEVLYDLDVIFKNKLENEQIQYTRIRTISDNPLLIEALEDRIREILNKL